MIDLDLRNRTYSEFVRLGRAPRAEELGPRDDVLAGWRRLHDAHALVLDADELRMANPFSAVPTPYRVEAGGRPWYGNCAWDAFGICVVLGGGGRIEHRDIVAEVTAGRTTRRSPSRCSSRRGTGGTTSSTPEAR